MTTEQTQTITARIYDTDGSDSWCASDYPAPRDGETVTQYAYRLQRWARREMLTVGGCASVSEVEHAYEAAVIVSVETDDEYVNYYLSAE